VPHPLLPKLEAVARQTCAAHGCELRGVALLSHRIPMTLQVLVQRASGGEITLDNCAALSPPLAEALESEGLLTDEAYVLEVSSPGIGEELRDDRDFRSFRGFPVAVHFRDAKGSASRCEGLLLERTASELQINQRGRTRRIPREAVTQVLLVTPAIES
jgi:ribosome maturation factor RimP